MAKKAQKALEEEGFPMPEAPETPEMTLDEAVQTEKPVEKAEKSEKSAEIEAIPPEEALAPGNPTLREEMKAILNVKKGKRDPPTRVTYYSPYSKSDRWIIIDVNCSLLERAWQVYKQKSEDKSKDVFLATVYDILKCDIPRMYVAVAELRLE